MADTPIIDLTDDPHAVATAEPVTASDDVAVVATSGNEGETLPANAELQPDGSVILTFLYPLSWKWKRAGSDQVRDEHRATLRMYRLNGAAMRAVMSAGQGHAVTTGIAKSCRMEQGLFNVMYDRMDGADATAAARVFSFFLNGGVQTPTGQPASP